MLYAIRDAHQSHGRFSMCVTRSTPRTVPHPPPHPHGKSHPPSAFLPFLLFFFFSLFFNADRCRTTSAEKGFFRSSSPPCPCMQATFLRDATRPPLEPRKPGKRGGGRASPKLHAASFLSTANASRDTFQDRHPRPPLFLFLSLIQHGMARRMPSPVVRSLVCLVKRRTGNRNASPS